MASASTREEDRSPLVCVIDDDVSLLRALRRLLGADGLQALQGPLIFVGTHPGNAVEKVENAAALVGTKGGIGG